MENQNIIKFVIMMYLGTALGNVIIAGLLYYFGGKSKAHLKALSYWLFILAGSFINGLIDGVGFNFVFVSMIENTYRQSLVAHIFTDLYHIKYQKWPIFVAALFLTALTFILYHLGIDPLFASIPILLMIFTFNYIIYVSLKKISEPITLIQKLYIFIGTLLSIHYSTIVYARTHPDFVVFGFVLAFIFIQIQSILMPMMINEKSHLIRLANLEKEISDKVSELNHANINLLESNKMASLGKMAGGIAHEVNTPLATVQLQLKKLSDLNKINQLSPEVINTSIIKIDHVIQKISKIIHNLRIFARDSQNSQKEIIRLDQIIDETLSFCFDKMDQCQIKFTYDNPLKDKTVLVNSIEISQILVNLLNNSIDAVKNTQEPFIQIQVEELNPSHLFIRITDSGTISQDIVDKVMDPYFTTKPIGHGTGLGLPIAYSLALKNGGKLEVNKNYQYTQFVLSLPLASASFHEKINL